MVNKQEFIYSAFAAISIYLILILSFLLYVQSAEVKKIDASVKTTVLQLDVILNTPNEKKEKTPVKSNIKNTQLAKKVVKKTTSTNIKQRSDLKSLFANVKTSVTKTSKSQVLNVKKSSIASRFKSKFEKQKKTKNIVLSKLSQNVKVNTNNKNVSMNKVKNKEDPYYSKIYEILSSRWNPTVYDNDLKAILNITIFNNGKFSYKFIQYSGNDGFDNELKSFLNRETQKTYPISPSKKTVSIEVILRSKG